MKILLVTAHPDDEVIWLGSTLHELSKKPNVQIKVICLWGALEKPGTMSAVTPGFSDWDREKHFYEACTNQGYNDCKIFVDEKFEAPANEYQTDENLNISFNICLEDVGDYDILITHSPDGDERKHPHHVRLYDFFRKFTLENNIPFGFFSTFENDKIKMSQLKESIYRCEPNIFGVDYFIKFENDVEKKLQSMKIYKSVDFNKHYNDYYAMRTGNENIYLEQQSYEKMKEILVWE
tara:strand:+ start:90 stop:797 length:708 start_codon:yes stop_codon:yes gene_type:complete